MNRDKISRIILEQRVMPDFYGEETDWEMPPVEEQYFRCARALAEDWEYVRENVYPALMPAGSRRLVDGMVHTLMLDLAVAYAIHMGQAGGEEVIVWIEDHFLDGYGISREELHGQALKNLEKDGYSFQRLEAALLGIPGIFIEEGKPGQPGKVSLYVLTNQAGWYGAAGLLAKETVRQFAGGCDYYILPSSLHELIFAPASDVKDPEGLDRIVEEISLMIVAEKDRLSSHSYFYDASKDEVRLCR